MVRLYRGFRTDQKKHRIKFQIIKASRYLKAHTALNKDRRNNLITGYNYIFKDNHSFERNNAIAENKFYTPISIIVQELVSKERIQNVKKGLKRLISSNSTHKFIGAVILESDVDDLMLFLDNSISGSESWRRMGRYDFENNYIKEYVSYYDIIFRNFSSSYFVIEIHLFISEKQKSIINKLINANYTDKSEYACGYYQQNNKETGAELGYTVGQLTSEIIKNELINDNIQEIKWHTLNYLSKYFPLQFTKANILPPSIIVYNTNISYDDEAYSFWHSVGIINPNGLFLSESRKLFFENELSKETKAKQTDLILIVNTETEPIDDLYHSIESQLMHHLFYELDNYYKMNVLNAFSNWYISICARYRNIINKSKISHHKYKRLLKLRYKFETDFSDFNKVFKEIDIDKEWKRANRFMESFEYAQKSKFKPYRNLTEYPVVLMKRIETNRMKLEYDLSRKIELSNYLLAYKNEKRNYFINFIMLLITSLTFILIIFPDLAIYIADKLLEFYNWIQK